MNTALVVAAHPDDEVLGCGGTIAKMADEGWSVHVLILAEGATSRSRKRDRNAKRGELSALVKSAKAAAKVLGAKSVEVLAFADNRMDGVELLDVVKAVEDRIAKFGPTRVLTHHRGDVNVDHQMVHDAVLAAVRPLPGTTVREVLFFEVASSTEWRPASSLPAFAPALFVDIGLTIDRKLRALEAYSSELRAFPHPRSKEAVEHLARWRGATAGVMAAEAFEVGRILA
jgi:LmbE family N-acetylglucosaminyl deacetylase